MKEFILTLILRMTHRLWNRQISRILCRAYGDGVIGSKEVHILSAAFDPTQSHRVYGKERHLPLNGSPAQPDKIRQTASIMQEKFLADQQRKMFAGCKCLPIAFSLLLCLPLLSGCDAVEASSAAPPAPALWSAADAQQALADLRAIREQTKMLNEIKQQTAAATAVIATLTDRQVELIDQLKQSSTSTTDAVAKVSSSLTDLQTDIDGVEQRLDNPLFPPAPPQPSSPLSLSPQPSASSAIPLCVTIAGIDYDLPSLIADYYESPWTWVGSQDENGLRKHLADHGVTNIDGLSFARLKKLHAAVHEKEIAARQAPVSSGIEMGATGDLQLFGDVQPKNNPPDQLAVNPPDKTEPQQNCPNGQCPNLNRSKTVHVTRTEPAGSSTVTRSRSVSCPGGICPAPGVSYRQTYYRSAPRSRVRWFR